MTPQRWSQIREVFGAAMQMTEDERAKFLETACGGDASLRSEVERLLAGAADPTWRSPLAELYPTLAKLEPGDTLSHYRLQARVGAGGMGVVFRAKDIQLHRDVALKILPEEYRQHPQALERFKREARAAAALKPSEYLHYPRNRRACGAALYCHGASGGTNPQRPPYRESV